MKNKLLNGIEADIDDEYEQQFLLPNEKKQNDAKGLLLHRLKDPFQGDRINLKELRDNLLGCRASRSVLVAWGVCDEGRLGVEIEESAGPTKMMQTLNGQDSDPEADMNTMKPTLVQIPTQANVIKVAWGNSHTLALIDDGTVFSWGINNKGCLGLPQKDEDNNLIDYTKPQRIIKDTYGVLFNSMKDIACGGTHSLALSIENRTYSWGNGEGGRLGHGSERSEAIPKEIESLRNVQPKSIFGGDVHSACLSMKNQLYTWGKGSYGRLGLGFTIDSLKPEHVEEFSSLTVEDVELGAYHGFAIWNDKNVYAWGGCTNGKLGIRGKSSGNLILPKPIPSFSNKKITEISAGPYHTLCINSKGSLFAWGNARQGKLGIESRGWKEVPTLVDNDTKFGSYKYRNYQENLTKIKDKRFFEENEYFDDDENIKKEDLFSNYDEGFKIKTKKESTKSLELVQVWTWEKQTFFLSNSGEVYACGASDNKLLDSILGEQSAENEANPGKLDFLPDGMREFWADFLNKNDLMDPRPIPLFTGISEHRVTHLSCGAKHVVAVTQKGEAYSWGNGTKGQLGLGSKFEYTGVPKLIKMFESVKMSAWGDVHSLLLANSGIVYFFGFNPTASSKNNTNNQTTPESIERITSAIYISAGSWHNAVIRINNDAHEEIQREVFTWGKGWNYQLGNQKRTNLPKPEIVDFSKFWVNNYFRYWSRDNDYSMRI